MTNDLGDPFPTNTVTRRFRRDAQRRRRCAQCWARRPFLVPAWLTGCRCDRPAWEPYR